MLSLPSCAMIAPPFSPWIARWAPRLRARLRLIFLPAAGGGASIYRDWALMLPPAIDVCAIRLPGREKRVAERQRRSLTSMLERPSR